MLERKVLQIYLNITKALCRENEKRITYLNYSPPVGMRIIYLVAFRPRNILAPAMIYEYIVHIYTHIQKKQAP